MAVGIRSSSTIRPAFRSIPSRGRRISETVAGGDDFTASEEEAPAGGGWGACQPGPLAERIGNVELNPLRSALLCTLGPRPATCLSAPKICSLKPTPHGPPHRNV